MRLVFDRGTVVLHDIPSDLNPAEIPGVLWDPRIDSWRAPARMSYGLTSELKRRAVPLSDTPRPRLGPPAGFRPVPLRAYQQAALSAWRMHGRRGVIALPTGSGKTRVALAAMAAIPAPALCLVPTRALMGQWISVIREFYSGPIGCFGDGERTLHPITVATYASAFRHMAFLGDRFGLLVADEAHHVGQGHHGDALDMAIAPLRLGLTATAPPAGDAASRLTRLVGPVVFERGIGDLAGDALAPFERFVLRLWLDPDEQREYDELRAAYRHALRLFQLSHPRGQWEDFLRAASETDEGRRGLAAWRRARRLLAFPRCKRQALAALLDATRARKTLVFVADNETAYAVARRHLIMPLTCDIGPKERATMLERFRAGDLRALVSAQVLNEGLDVPDADVGIIVAGRMGEREHVQRVGRLLRPAEGKRAAVYEFVVQRSSEVRQAERRWDRLAGTVRTAA